VEKEEKKPNRTRSKEQYEMVSQNENTQIKEIKESEEEVPPQTMMNTMFGLHNVPQPFMFVPQQQYYFYSMAVPTNNNQY